MGVMYKQHKNNIPNVFDINNVWCFRSSSMDRFATF